MLRVSVYFSKRLMLIGQRLVNWLIGVRLQLIIWNLTPINPNYAAKCLLANSIYQSKHAGFAIASRFNTFSTG